VLALIVIQVFCNGGINFIFLENLVHTNVVYKKLKTLRTMSRTRLCKMVVEDP